MLTYSFENIGNDTLYEHLYKCIKSDILSKKLNPHDKLPSKRSFAKNLGLSVITVENSYNQLLAEGYLYSIPKKGFYVSEINELYKRLPDITNANPKESYEIAPDFQKYFANFTSNQTSDDIFPFSIWSKLMRELLAYHQEELMTRSPFNGVYELRLAIANHLRDFHGMSVTPDQIVIGAGTDYLYGLLIQILGFDKNYGVENPGYEKIRKIYNSYKVQYTPIEMTKGGIDISSLNKKHVDIVHISPSHHFPTGIVMPIARRMELLNWANENDKRYIIEDDYDSEFRFVGQPIPTLQSIDKSNKVIYMNTFTKTLSSTIRISYMVLPHDLTREFEKNFSFYSCTVSNFEQYTLSNFINQGYFEKHLNRMRTYYHNKRDILLNCIRKSPISDYVKIKEEDSGLHFLMEINTQLEADDLLDKIKRADIKISALSDYYVNPIQKFSKTFVINYSSIPEDKMEEAINRLYLAIC